MSKSISTAYIITLTAGVVLYVILLATLLAAVGFRSACGSVCEAAACELHKTTAFMLTYALASNLVVPLVLCFWISCISRWKRVAYTLLGSFLVVNATLACGAGTLIVTVEHLLCPSDPAVEFAGVLLIFVAQTWSAMLVEVVFRKRQALDEAYTYNTFEKMEAAGVADRFVEGSDEEL